MPLRKRVTLHRNLYGYGFALKNQFPSVVDFVVFNSPADLVGIDCGYALVAINGIPVGNVSHADISSLIWTTPSPIDLEFSVPDTTSPMETEVYGTCSTPHTKIESPLETPPVTPNVTQESNYSALFSSPVAGCKRSAVMLYVTKLTINARIELTHKLLVQKLLPLRRKADHEVVDNLNMDSICLFEVFTECLRVFFPSKAFEYSRTDMSYVGPLGDDRRFFFMLTYGRRLISGTDKQPTDGNNVATAHVFRCLPPSLLGHRAHADIVERFRLCCQRDRLTGDCAQFPRTALPLIKDLLTIVNEPVCKRTRSTDTPLQLRGQMRRAETVVREPTGVGRNTHRTRSECANDFSIATPVCSTTTPSIKRPMTASRTSSSSRLFGKLAKAAGYFRDRWLDKHHTSVQSPSASFLRKNPSTSSADFPSSPSRHSLPYVTKSNHSVASLCSLNEAQMEETPNQDSPRSSKVAHANFDRLLDDPVGIEMFRAFLKSEFSSENLDFWCSARNWRLRFPMEEAHEEAQRLYSTYLDTSAPLAVNVDQSTVQCVTDRMSCLSAYTFEEAEKQVYRLMKMDSYARFLDSPFNRLPHSTLPSSSPLLCQKETSMNQFKRPPVPLRSTSIGVPCRMSLDASALLMGESTPTVSSAASRVSRRRKSSTDDILRPDDCLSPTFRRPILKDRSNVTLN